MTAKTKPRIIIETTVLRDKFFYSSVADDIKKLSVNSKLFTSFFIIYEFKAGFLKGLIDYYYLIKIKGNIADAKITWSNNFKMRDIKNSLLIEALILKIFGKWDTSTVETYLYQIESAIFYLSTNMCTEIDEVIGYFGDSKVVKYDVKGNADYKDFVETIIKNKLPFDKFWDENKVVLLSLLNGITTRTGKNKPVAKIYQSLLKIQEDLSNSMKSNVSKSVGDAVITVDTPILFKVATTDSSFDELCPILSKEVIKITRDHNIAHI
jgi:hypothetical protein